MSKRAEMIGKKFGLLTVMALSKNRSGKRKRLMYLCDCDCGNKNVEVIGEHLRSGHTLSCGCLQKKIASYTHKKFNDFDLSGEFGIGVAKNTGNHFLFDLEDYEKIKDYCWFEMQNGYITTHIIDERGNTKWIYFHRLVTNARPKDIVDHIYHCKLDNRKRSLRVGTQSNNMMNLKMRKDNTSGITGVTMDKRNGKWIAEITRDKKKVFLGTFKEKEEAIKARKEAENMFFGDWSYQNSITKKETIL